MKYTLLIPIFALLGLCACEPDGLYDSPISVSEKVQVAQGIVVQNHTENRLELLSVGQRTLRNRVLFTPEEGEIIHRVFAGKENENSPNVYVVTYPASARQTDISPTLSVIETATGNVTRYSTNSLFGNQHFDPDGRYIILYHSDTDDAYVGGLSNDNEIAIIDLNSPPSAANPFADSIDISGHTIESITFLNEITIGDTVRKLVAFSTRGNIQFTDFNDENFASVTVNLKNDDDPRIIIPDKFQLLPAQGNRGPRLFVKANGASEIYDIEFNVKDNEVGFYATSALLDSGYVPSDFALVQDDTDLLLVTAAGNTRQLTIFETDTAAAVSVVLDDMVSTIFEREQNGLRELVMFGSNTQNIYFLPFDNLKAEKGDNLESLTVPSGISSAYILDNDRLMIFSSSNYNVTILDLRTRTMTNLSGASGSNWTEGKLWNETYFLAEYDMVAFLNILSGSPGTLALDEPISSLYVFEQQGVGVAMHSNPAGRATLFPLQMPTRAASTIVDGFYVEGILNRGEE
ncbi:MAG: hypothetical protein JXX29_14665 [Deltaproteobacteria bacterium]|nr:hypothetical protein [Deltaproteobacteria bacterium]MBN2672923.1 hypothetical protein [Deltaproteobacteria bacterium]